MASIVPSTPIDVSRRPNARRALAKNPCALARAPRPKPTVSSSLVPASSPNASHAFIAIVPRPPSVARARSRVALARAPASPIHPSRRRRARPQRDSSTSHDSPKHQQRIHHARPSRWIDRSIDVTFALDRAPSCPPKTPRRPRRARIVTPASSPPSPDPPRSAPSSGARARRGARTPPRCIARDPSRRS